MAKLFRYFSLAGLATLAIAMTGCSSSRYTCCTDENIVDTTYVHKYGVAVPSDFWTSSGEHGSVISTMGDGVVVNKGYTSGALDGDTTTTYPHSSQIQKCESYQMGTLVRETEYFFDGTPKCQITYNTPAPGMSTVCRWYLSGTPKCNETYNGGQLVTAEYLTNLNQRDAFVDHAQGTRLSRDDYGQLISTDKIENGQMVLSQSYHPNGSPKETIPYRNGNIDGVKRTYLPAGEPDSIEQWVNGQQEGTSVVYQHGEKYAEIPYANGEKHGIECRYRDGKTKVQDIGWSNGQLHGPSKTYVGETEKNEWYYRGRAVSKTDYEFMTNRPIVR